VTFHNDCSLNSFNCLVNCLDMGDCFTNKRTGRLKIGGFRSSNRKGLKNQGSTSEPSAVVVQRKRYMVLGCNYVALSKMSLRDEIHFTITVPVTTVAHLQLVFIRVIRMESVF